MELHTIINEMKMAKSVLEKHENSCGWNHIGVKIAICNSINWLEEYVNSSTSHNTDYDSESEKDSTPQGDIEQSSTSHNQY